MRRGARRLAFGVDNHACVFCLESEPPPIQSGCACRGEQGLAHVECRAKHAESKSSIVNDNWWKCSTCRQAFTGEMRRRLSAALSALVRHLPADDSSRKYAAMLGAMGARAEDAERFWRREHAELRATYGEDHESTLQAAGALGTALVGKGEPHDAEQLFRLVLDGRRRVIGPESEGTVAAMHSLATVLSEQGKCAEAGRLFSEALPISERLNGAENAYTLKLRSELARNLMRQDKHAEAAQAIRKLLADVTRVMGAEHPWVSILKADLAAALLPLGKLAEAEQLQREALAADTRHFGEQGARTKQITKALAETVELRRRAQSSAPAMRVGGRVAVHGLVANAQYNGSLGRVLAAPVLEGDRYTVGLDTGTQMRIWRENLRDVRVCAGCGIESGTARACGGCEAAWYCGVECQRAHWRTHKPACKPRPGRA